MFTTGFEPQHRRDTFNNLIVYLPYGQANKLIKGYDDWDDYVITEEELSNAENNASLAGLPVVIFHPDSLITPDTPSRQVGSCTGKYRKNSKGVYEAEARITCKKTIRSILRKELTETSAGYISRGSSRVYNHLALTLPNTARGGKDMQIKLESTRNLVQTNMNPEQIKEIADQVISSMKTEAASFQEMLASAKLEGKTDGYTQGVKEGRLIAKAEKYGFKAEAGKSFLESFYTPIMSRYLPALAKKECCNEDQMAYVEAALEVADAQEMAMPKEETEEEIEAKEEMKTEAIKTPRLAGFKQDSTPVVKRTSGNFLLG